MNCLAILVSVLNGLTVQVQSSAPTVSTEPTSTVALIFIIIAIIASFVMYGICGVVFARFAMKQGWCAALIIIIFWLGVFLSPFVVIPIIIVFIYKRAKQPAEGQSPG